MSPHKLARVALDDTLRQISAAALDKIADSAERGSDRAVENCRMARGQLAPPDIEQDIHALDQLAEWCRHAARRKAEIRRAKP